jgi:hypothetical protein
MFGAEIPDGLVYGVVPVLVTIWATLFGWTLLLLYKTTVTVAVHEQRLDNLEREAGVRLPVARVETG